MLNYAERRTRACLAELDDGERRAEDVLEAREGDLTIRLHATVAGDALTLDFTGTAPQHEGNLNCPLAVTRLGACYFAVRVFSDPDIPANAGAYRPVEVIAPEGCLLNARSPAAVVGGNVETSSRVADVVLGAFGRALGQGTMNNVTLGDSEVTYYETIGGGQGACPDADGPSGVHVAMSNTLNTPIEALELEFPMRMVEYSLRRGPGGPGRFRGGDGVVREIEALAPLHYSLITERRRHPPPGAAGGEPGACGRNLLDGEELPPKSTGELAPGQRLRIETPGGGGYGRPDCGGSAPPPDRRADAARPALPLHLSPSATDKQPLRGRRFDLVQRDNRSLFSGEFGDSQHLAYNPARVPAALHSLSDVRAPRGHFNHPSSPFISYADCFQRMGRHRAGTRRGRAIADAPQGRYSRT